VTGDPRATLLLDDLLLTAGPTVVHALRAQVPPHLLDQADAAARDARTLLGRVAEATGTTPRNVAVVAVEGWLRLAAVDALRGFLDGSARVCTHNPSLRRYELIFACAWRPGLVVCAHCIPLLKAPTKLADATCDRCGRVCTGPATGDGIHPLVVQIGALTFNAGACGDCRPDHPVHTTEEMTR
jgi:hypothetical protein